MSLRTLSRVAFCIALVAVVAGSLMPGDWITLFMDRHDKEIHLLGYFALAMLGAIGWPRWQGWALVGLPVLGFALEVTQSATGRSFDWGDVLMNAAGIGLAVAAATVFTRWMARE